MGGEDSPLPLIYTQMSGNVNFIGTQEEWDALVEKNKLRLSAMKKQTAVDWLEEQRKWSVITNEHIEQAKAMEKEQIINTYHEGRFSGQTNWSAGNDITAEQYYTSTYNNTQS